jgi:predicted GNAT family acetyltransferase
MNDSILIRHASPEDAAVLAAFNARMALETEGRALDPDTVRKGVEAMLQHSDFGFYLIAEEGDAPVGCLMITSEWSDWRNGLFWWIQSVYVVPEKRRHGVFSSLFRQLGKMTTDRDDICGLRLYVERDNLAAQSTYHALGMKETPYRLFEIEAGEPNEE